MRTALRFVRRHFSALALITAALVFANWAVAKYKRPGQMTVIEAQARDMSAMKPPVGSHPVATETVHRTFFEASVTYTGTVVPYLEQTVYPRVTGWLSGLSAYAGGRVRKGQLLGWLEAPEPQVEAVRASREALGAQAEAGAASAQAAKAGAEKEALLAEVSAAETDLDAARSELSTAAQSVRLAEAEVRQAQAALRQARSAVDQAEAAVEDARKAEDSARAELTYWQAEIRRAEKLFESGAVSRDEYEAERARYESAAAAYASAQAKVRQAEAGLRSAQESVAEREAMVQAAEERLGQARSTVSAAAARVRGRKALVTSVRKRAEAVHAEQESAIRAARSKSASAETAGLAGRVASIFDRYRDIRSPVDGVVLERLVHPGTLVGPGIGVLRVADYSRLRVQVNVPERDLRGIRVGNRMRIRVPGSGRTLETRVTSIFPQADPSSRTAIVESVIPPSAGIGLGDYVVATIATFTFPKAISVPTRAITSFNAEGRPAVWIAVKEGEDIVFACPMHPEVVQKTPGRCPKCGMELVKKSVPSRTHTMYYCTMHPEVRQDHPGTCPKCGMKLEPMEKGGPKRAHQVFVKVGPSSGDRTVILSGLKEGDEVIVAGYQTLREGDSVTPVEWGPNGPKLLPPPTEAEPAPAEAGHAAHMVTDPSYQEVERCRTVRLTQALRLVLAR
ncbi:MAG: heavy metal-binding domain-containing protein [Armatimonadota bacterium]